MTDAKIIKNEVIKMLQGISDLYAEYVEEIKQIPDDDPELAERIMVKTVKLHKELDRFVK